MFCFQLVECFIFAFAIYGLMTYFYHLNFNYDENGIIYGLDYYNQLLFYDKAFLESVLALGLLPTVLNIILSK